MCVVRREMKRESKPRRGKERKGWKLKACRRAREKEGRGRGNSRGPKTFRQPSGRRETGCKARARAEASFYLAGSRSPERPQARFQMSVGRCRQCRPPNGLGALSSPSLYSHPPALSPKTGQICPIPDLSLSDFGGRIMVASAPRVRYVIVCTGRPRSPARPFNATYTLINSASPHSPPTPIPTTPPMSGPAQTDFSGICLQCQGTEAPPSTCGSKFHPRLA